MDPEIITIPLKVPCYLMKTQDGWVLIDTGDASDQVALKKELDRAGVSAENLRLIILTHGDFDHAGNAAFLQKKFGVRVAMHSDDWGMVEHSDMGWNRKAKPDYLSFTARLVGLIAPLFGPGKFEPFKPDLALDESTDLTQFGWDARIVYLPGHSKGSIGILIPDRILFCGDLIYNVFGKPGCPFINDFPDFNASIEKLTKLGIKTVYPGHGKPFQFSQFLKGYKKTIP